MKNKNVCKILALALAFCLALSSAAFAAVLGDPVDGYETAAPGGIQLARGVYWTGSDYRTENYVEYTPSREVFPVVVYGSKVTNYGSFSSMASLLEKQGYHVIAGINGDYFNTWDYQPLGIVITEGVLRSSDDGHWAVGFRADGSTMMGKPALTMKVSIGENNYTLASVNKSRSETEYSLFTEDYAPTTKINKPGRYAILSMPEDELLTVNCELTLTVEEIVESEKAVAIPAGKLVLSLADTADDWRQEGMDSLQTGSKVTLAISCAEDWDGVQYAVGSLYKLVTDGQVEDALEAGNAPRTAVGLKEDGTLVLYTIDGRKSGHSMGASMSQVAQRLIEMGCVEACVMDGGGSTSLNAIYIGDESISQINNPSDGSQRSVTNYIMLVTKAEKTGVAEQLALYPLSTHVLPGATVQFEAKAADKNGYAAEVPSGLVFSTDVGIIDGSGKYTAGGSGTGSVTVSKQGLTSGSVVVNVVETPDLITVKNEATGKIVTSLTLETEGSVDLIANAAANYVELISDDSCYTWAVTGEIGTIDETGKFIASGEPGTGTIEVTAGAKTVSIPVEVKNPLGVFEDVLETDPYYDAVKFVGEAGIFNGMTDTEFGPMGEMTRAMFATALWRLEGQPPVEIKNEFTDVADGKWYTTAVLWANAQGIVEGYGNGLFGVNDTITREQMATMLYRYAESKELDVAVSEEGQARYAAFADTADVSAWAGAAACWALDRGIMSGETETTLAPRSAALRHVVATAFMGYSLMVTGGGNA